MSERAAGNWLAGYMFFTKEIESPHSFLFWTGIAALAGAVQRRVWFKWKYNNIYPNMYVTLIGPPGTGKNQAIGPAASFLRAIGSPLSAEAMTKEGLIGHMLEKVRVQEIGGMLYQTAPITVVARDFMTFFRPSAESIVEWLTDLFDAGEYEDGWTYKIRSRPEETIPKPYVNLMAGTTPGWMADNFKVGFTEQGFAARMIYVYADKPRFKRAKANITLEMWDMRDKLIEDLKHISNLEGEFHMTKEGWEYFTELYEIKIPAWRVDHRLEGYKERKGLHLLKIAMLASLAERDELVLDLQMIQFAEAQLANIEPHMVRAFQGVGRNPISGNIMRIYEDIAVSGPLSKGELVERYSSDLSAMQLDEVLNNLQLMRKVTIDIKNNGEMYYRAIGTRPSNPNIRSIKP